MAVDVREVVEQAREVMTGRRVFSEPYERDGVTVILASRVQGGGGGGSGQEGSPAGSDRRGQTGWGGGFGVTAAPVGAFVLRGGEVRWVPAVDVNKLAVGAQVVAVVALLTLRRLAKLRRKRG